jgi:hypothetical protein
VLPGGDPILSDIFTPALSSPQDQVDKPMFYLEYKLFGMQSACLDKKGRHLLLQEHGRRIT